MANGSAKDSKWETECSNTKETFKESGVVNPYSRKDKDMSSVRCKCDRCNIMKSCYRAYNKYLCKECIDKEDRESDSYIRMQEGLK